MNRIIAMAALAVAVAGCAPQTVVANKRQAVIEAWFHSDAVALAEKECGTHDRWPMLQRQQGAEYWFSCNEKEEAVAARIKAQQEAAMRRAAELRLFVPRETQVASASGPVAIPAAVPAAPGGTWVQLGAFRSRAAAERYLREIRSVHRTAVTGHGLRVDEKAVAGKGIFHVARLGPFGARAEARRTCGALKSHGAACFVVRSP